MSIISFCNPSFATDPDIPASTTSLSCDDSALNDDNGPVNIEVNWEPNTINLHWYDGDTELNVANESQSCVYDSTLTPPQTIPTKTGYTFRGWKTKCVLSSLLDVDTSINSNIWAVKKLDNGSGNVSGGATAATYGLTQNGEWGITFSYGKLKGMAYCSALYGNNNNSSANWHKPLSNVISAGEGVYCWCQAKLFTPTGANSGCALNMDPIEVRIFDTSENCKNKCAQRCANLIGSTERNRTVLYGQE